MEKETETGKLSFLSLLLGIAIGALGALSMKSSHESDDVLDLTKEAETVLPGLDGVAAFEDITPDNTTLLDSLEGISVNGPEADLLKVRVLGLERAKTVAMWGSKGVSGNEPTKFQRMTDLTTEHLLNIKQNSEKVSPDERRIIDSILEDRVAEGVADASVLDVKYRSL